MSRVKPYGITSPARHKARSVIFYLALGPAIILVALIPLVAVYKWIKSPSTPSVHTTSTSPRQNSAVLYGVCDNVYRDYQIGSVPSLVNGGRKFQIDWTVAEGRVRFINQEGVTSKPIGPTDILGRDFHIVRWKSDGASAVITARFRC